MEVKEKISRWGFNLPTMGIHGGHFYKWSGDPSLVRVINWTGTRRLWGYLAERAGMPTGKSEALAGVFAQDMALLGDHAQEFQALLSCATTHPELVKVWEENKSWYSKHD